jgi:23S rRNA (uracil1939-C5)-methyltransferase
VSAGLEVGDRLELEIERLAAGGDGIAHHDGRAVFVPASAPGDRAVCRVVQVRRRFARAEIESVSVPGPARREPRCVFYGSCGGCDWMHLDDAAQATARREILSDALSRIGHLRDLPPIEWLASPAPFGYRARARVACQDGRVGFRAAGSRDVVDVSECVVLDPATQRELARLRRTPPTAGGEIEIRGFGGEAAGLRVGPGAFFQANGLLWDIWQRTVADACGEGELAVELYAGVGFYTAALARTFKRVIAVERSRSAGDLRHNTSAEVHQTSAERFAITRLPDLAPDVVLLNPPRTGCDAIVVDAVRSRMPRRIVYVSCDPATLARDVSRLEHDFIVRRVVAIDALPQTSGVESLLVLDSHTD